MVGFLKGLINLLLNIVLLQHKPQEFIKMTEEEKAAGRKYWLVLFVIIGIVLAVKYL